MQSKFEGSAILEDSCKTWNRLLSRFHPGQLSLAGSDTLSTAVNLQWWSVQCDAKCLLCDSNRPKTAHVLSVCPTALNQQHYTFQHNQVLSILASAFTNLFLMLLLSRCMPICQISMLIKLPKQQFHLIIWCPNMKQSKVEYLQLLAEFDCLKIGYYYDTIEISVLTTIYGQNLLKLLALQILI